jgi:hypothetical protein
VTSPVLESAAAYPELGVNRVVDPNFYAGTSKWATFQSQSNMLQGGLTVGTDATTGKRFVQQTVQYPTTSDLIGIYSGDLTPVAATEWLSVSAGVSATAGVGNITLSVQFFDANGNYLTELVAGSLSAGAHGFNTVISGYVQAPANARSMRLVADYWASALNTPQTVTLTDPIVTASPDVEINRVQDSQFVNGTGNWSMYQGQSGMLIGGMTAGVDPATGKRFLQQSFQGVTGSNLVAFCENDFVPVEGSGCSSSTRTAITSAKPPLPHSPALRPSALPLPVSSTLRQMRGRRASSSISGRARTTSPRP